MTKTAKKASLYYLRAREMGFCASVPRNDYKLFGHLVISKSRVFRKKQEFNSSAPIFFEADRIYVNHYRRAHSVVKRNLIYDLDHSVLHSSAKERITDADIFYLTSASEPADILRSELFIGLTDLHRLLLLDATTGKFLRAFQLPPKEQGYKFTEIGIGRDNETLYVKGRVLSLRLPLSLSRQPHFVFGLFQLSPFKFHCMFMLSETVFGPFTNVSISQDLLIFAQSGSIMKFYSLDEVIALARPIIRDDVAANGVLLPNLSVEDSPPCLYSVRVTAESLEMGGFPWYCLYKPPKKPQYRLECLAIGAPVKLEPDQLRQTDPGQGMEVNVFFHPDESGSIIFVSETEVQKLIITKPYKDTAENETLWLKLDWSVAIAKPFSAEEDVVYTASGRKASRSSWTFNDDAQYVHCVQYLSSIDALCIIVYYEATPADHALESAYRSKKQSYGGKAKILIVDNISGRITKEIFLDEPWDNACEEHHVELDDDVLIHTIKHRSGKHSCHVYQLTEVVEDGNERDHGRTRKKKRRQNNDHDSSVIGRKRRRNVDRVANDSVVISQNAANTRRTRRR